MRPGAGAMDGHGHTSLVECDDSTPRRTLVREWRVVLCPDHTAWACSGLGVEFLPLKLPCGGRSECEKKAEGVHGGGDPV